MDKSDYIKVKDFCSRKDTIKRVNCHELGEAVCNAYPSKEFLQVQDELSERKKTGETLDLILSESDIECQKQKHMFNLT